MTIRRNDPPGDMLITGWQQPEWGDEHVRIAGIEGTPQVHHAAVGFRHRDLTQLGYNRFTENEANAVGSTGQACISRGSGSNQPGVQNGGYRGRRGNRKAEENEKKGRPH